MLPRVDSRSIRYPVVSVKLKIWPPVGAGLGPRGVGRSRASNLPIFFVVLGTMFHANVSHDGLPLVDQWGGKLGTKENPDSRGY